MRSNGRFALQNRVLVTFELYRVIKQPCLVNLLAFFSAARPALQCGFNGFLNSGVSFLGEGGK
jgi:hypothetical protein